MNKIRLLRGAFASAVISAALLLRAGTQSAVAAQDETDAPAVPSMATPSTAPAVDDDAGAGGSATSRDSNQPREDYLSNLVGGRFGRNMNESDRSALNDFLNDHMPNLGQMILRTPRGPKLRQLLVFARTRFDSLQRAQNDSDMLDHIARNIQSEDELFAYAAQARDAQPAQREVIRNQIRQKMAKLVDSLLAERGERLAKLREKLDDEQRRLEDDRKSRDQIIERRLGALLWNDADSTRNSDSPTSQPSGQQPGEAANAPARDGSRE